MVRVVRGLGIGLVTLAVLATATASEFAMGESSSARIIRVAQKSKTVKKRTVGKSTKTADEPEASATPKPAAEEKPATAVSESGLKFSSDIAPILVANCAGCHIRKTKKGGNLDMTSFKKLMDGVPNKEKVIEAGKPGDSHLVLHVKGEEDPKMPPGQVNLSEGAIEKIEQWIKAGALLDAGKDPNAPIESYASSPEDLRKAQLAKQTPEQRDKMVEEIGLARWKKASPKNTPEVINGKHFLLFSTLPKTRADAVLKRLDEQYEAARTMLGKDAVEWGEKGSLFVFNDVGSFGEFVEANERRQVEAGDAATAEFTVPEPYAAAVDPMGGREGPEPLAAASTPKKASRTKRGKASAAVEEANLGGPDRSLAGLLTEQFISGVARRSGKPPRWLTLGLGALFASRVEPSSPYYRKIRGQAFEVCQLGWQSKASEALGDQDKTEVVRAVGFAILDWVVNWSPRSLQPFVTEMGAGGNKLDDAIGKVFSLSREQMLSASGQFIMSRYGR